MFGLNFDKLGQLQSNYNPNRANYNPTTTKKHQPRSSSSKHVENCNYTSTRKVLAFDKGRNEKATESRKIPKGLWQQPVQEQKV